MKAILACFVIPLALAAQAPRIGLIDFYGVRKVPEERIRKALEVKVGDPLPPSKADVEERLESVNGVVRAHLEAVCCEAGQAILFVGIEERGAPHFNFRDPPDKQVSLPEEVAKSYQGFMDALGDAVRKGDAAEDLTHGHALAANPNVRAFQQRFAAYAAGNVAVLRDVLRNSADADQRAMAAYIIGYAPKKQEIVNDLEYALQDSSGSVRNNAMRALGAIAVLAKRDPDLGIRIPTTWFIEMLNSILWTDRNKALFALVTLTENRNPEDVDQLRRRALPSLIEMARWKSLGHALPAFMLVGRIAGLSEQQIQDAWKNGERESVIEKVEREK